MYCIAYMPGAYGNFIGWTLNWLQGHYSAEDRPFAGKSQLNSYFNNHNYTKFKNYRSTVKHACSDTVTGALVHPILKKEDSLVNEINLLLNHYDKVIYIHADINDFVWQINNKFVKTSKEGWIYHNSHLLNADKEAWQEYEKWSQREHLSFFIHQQNYIETRYDEIILLNKERVKTIPMYRIRDDFTNLVQETAKWLGLDIKQNVSQMQELYDDWADREIFKDRDNLISNLVDATINNDDLDMTNLSIVDESQIQRQLRIQGYEIKCYRLNEWPSTTTQLRELIYKV